MAETLLLTFAEKFISYSLGENINLDKLEEIADIAVQHGLEVWVPEAPVL
jgi:predicted amino acid dehydrogenase